MWLAGAKTRARPTYQLLLHGCGLQIGCSRRTSNASYRFQIGPDGALGFQATGAESATGGSPSTTSTLAAASRSFPSAGRTLSCSNSAGAESAPRVSPSATATLAAAAKSFPSAGQNLSCSPFAGCVSFSPRVGMSIVRGDRSWQALAVSGVNFRGLRSYRSDLRANAEINGGRRWQTLALSHALQPL